MMIAGVTTDQPYTPADGADNPSARTAEIFHFLGPDPDKNIDIIVQRALAVIGGVFSTFIDTGGETPVIKSSCRLPRELARAFLSTKNCFTQIPRDEELIVFDDNDAGLALTDSLAGRFGVNALLGAVIRNNGKHAGILWVADSRPRTFSSDQIHALHCLAGALAYQTAAVTSGKTEQEKIGEMAGQLAHDLNNILTGLVSYPELVLMQLDKDSPLHTPISFMHESGVLASDMVQDFLLLARPKSYEPPSLDPVDVLRTYFSSSTHARFRYEHPHMQFSLETDGQAGMIRISEILLTKLITTLLAHLSARIRESSRAEIIVASHNLTDQEESRVAMIFRDNGKPIQRKDLSQIFAPFYAKKQLGHPGSGLGLTAVQKIVEDHGGKAMAGTADGTGLQIALFFPRENQ
ncbi:MAG TPA: hypothetical protein DHV36_22390 [Desulfobacteraceae bacterium]|nr:hypothetical protein [Desulfobacteraceae bacterium]